MAEFIWKQSYSCGQRELNLQMSINFLDVDPNSIEMVIPIQDLVHLKYHKQKQADA